MKAACQGDDAGEEASQFLYADSQRIVCANVRRVLTRVQTATNATRATDEDRSSLTFHNITVGFFLIFSHAEIWLIRFRPGRFDLGRYSGLEFFEIFDKQTG